MIQSRLSCSQAMQCWSHKFSSAKFDALDRIRSASFATAAEHSILSHSGRIAFKGCRILRRDLSFLAGIHQFLADLGDCIINRDFII